MDNRSFGRLIFILIATSTSFATTKSISFEDYGNGFNEDFFQLHDYMENSNDNSAEFKRDPEIYHNDKRNIISALRSKIRRSSSSPMLEDVEEKFKFAPVLSVDALNNLNGFFDNLATNIHTMESRNLLPNQMRLLGEAEYRPREPYGHSAAFVNSIRSYSPTKNIRKLLAYEPGVNYHSHPLITNINRKDRS